MSFGQDIRYFLFQLTERCRRFIHFRISGFGKSESNKGEGTNLSDYYKYYDQVYTLSDTPEFVAMYKNREVIYEDFSRHRQDRQIPETGSLLDIGCGEGGNSIYFQGQGYSVVGIDASENAIRLARKKAQDLSSNAVFEVADILDMKTIKNKFDICVDVGCLHMLVFKSHRNKYMESVRHLLAENGVFYLFQSASNKDVKIKDEEKYVAKSISFQNKKMLNDGKIVQCRGCGGMPVSLSQYCDELEEAGFHVKQSRLIRTPTGLFASLLVMQGNH